MCFSFPSAAPLFFLLHPQEGSDFREGSPVFLHNGLYLADSSRTTGREEMKQRAEEEKKKSNELNGNERLNFHFFVLFSTAAVSICAFHCLRLATPGVDC